MDRVEELLAEQLSHKDGHCGCGGCVGRRMANRVAELEAQLSEAIHVLRRIESEHYYARRQIIKVLRAFGDATHRDETK